MDGMTLNEWIAAAEKRCKAARQNGDVEPLETLLPAALRMLKAFAAVVEDARSYHMKQGMATGEVHLRLCQNIQDADAVVAEATGGGT